MQFEISNEGLSQFLSTVLHATLTSLPHQWTHHCLKSLFVKSSLVQESRDPTRRLRRGSPAGHRHYLHGQVPFTHPTIGRLQCGLYDGFRTTGSEQLFLQARTPHRHAREPPIGPPRSEHDIVEVPQRGQPSNRSSNLRRRSALHCEQSFDLGRRAIAASQRTHRKLQPLIRRCCCLACHSPTHCVKKTVTGFVWSGCLNQINQINKNKPIRLI
jgi:hypothetical protein